MSSPGAQGDELLLNLLLFSVDGVSYGVDVEQIDAMTGYSADGAEDLFWFHRLPGFAAGTVRYQAPTVLDIKTDKPESLRVIIDHMEDIVECAWNSIVPLPALLEPYLFRCGIWGVVQRHGVPVLLMDFQRIADKL